MGEGWKVGEGSGRGQNGEQIGWFWGIWGFYRSVSVWKGKFALEGVESGWDSEKCNLLVQFRIN